MKQQDRHLRRTPAPSGVEAAWASSSFLLTCGSVFGVTGWRWTAASEGGWATVAPAAVAFTVALMGVLLTHELGHYVVARVHGFRVSLPTFLPVPIFLGTLGALITLREPPRTRSGLLEMGAAGPLSGLVVVAGLAIVWLTLGPFGTPVGEARFARPLLLWALAALFGMGAPPPLHDGDPLGLAIAIGCLITAMNLLPFGQLDGGHILTALSPAHARLAGHFVIVTLLLLGLFWPGWAAWVALLYLLGARQGVEVGRADVPLTDRARGVALVCALCFLLTFTPVPLA